MPNEHDFIFREFRLAWWMHQVLMARYLFLLLCFPGNLIQSRISLNYFQRWLCILEKRTTSLVLKFETKWEADCQKQAVSNIEIMRMLIPLLRAHKDLLLMLV